MADGGQHVHRQPSKVTRDPPLDAQLAARVGHAQIDRAKCMARTRTLTKGGEKVPLNSCGADVLLKRGFLPSPVTARFPTGSAAGVGNEVVGREAEGEEVGALRIECRDEVRRNPEPSRRHPKPRRALPAAVALRRDSEQGKRCLKILPLLPFPWY